MILLYYIPSLVPGSQAQSIKHPTLGLGSGYDLQAGISSPTLGSTLSGKSSFSLLLPPPPCLLKHTLSLSEINKTLKK